MDTVKRKRGRPLSSGRKDDAGSLIKVAEMVARDPRLKPTTAMRRVIATGNTNPADDEALVRRLQAKWKVQHPALLAAARTRLQRESTARAVAQVLAYAGAMQTRLDAAIRSPMALELYARADHGLTLFERLFKSPEVLRGLEAVNSFQDQFNQLMRNPTFAKWAALRKPLTFPQQLLSDL